MYGRPAQTLNGDMLQSYIPNSDPQIRHYKWIRVHYANDSVILSFFLRFSLRGNNLFTELRIFLLTPPSEAYRELDNRRNVDEEESLIQMIVGWIARIVGMLVLAPFSLLAAIFLPLELVGRWWQRRQEKRAEEEQEKELVEEIEENPLYNWGIASSIREVVSSNRYDHYFQMVDREMYYKVIERTILDSIVDFLGEHNISTTDLKERRTTILNNGVIVQGGNIEAQALAVGQSAQATQQTTETGKGEG
jgi:hypothetical protein